MITSTGNCYKYYTQCYYTISTVVTKQSQVRVFTLLSPPDDHVSLPGSRSLQLPPCWEAVLPGQLL